MELDILSALKGEDSREVLDGSCFAEWPYSAGLSTGFNSGLPVPTTWSFSLFRSGQISNGIAWFSLTAGEYSNKTPDYFGIDFTLPTMTGNNSIPIVKERICLILGKTYHKNQENGTPYISALRDGVLRRFLDKAAYIRIGDRNAPSGVSAWNRQLPAVLSRLHQWVGLQTGLSS